MMLRLILAVLILAQALLLWSSGQAPWSPWLIALLGFFSAAAPAYVPLRRASRGWVVAIVFSAAVISSLMSYHDDLVGGGLPVLLTKLIGEAVLLWQVILISKMGNEDPIPHLFPSLCVVFLLCAFNRTIDTNSHSSYIIFTLLGVLASGVLFFLSGVPRAKYRQLWSGSRWARVAGVVACVAILTAITANTWAVVMKTVETYVPVWMVRPSGPSWIRGYTKSGDLTSITAQKQTNPQNVALRVYSRQSPGYLRGRVFERYSRGQWRLASSRYNNRLMTLRMHRELSERPNGIPEPPTRQKLFAVQPEESAPFSKMEIHNDETRGELFFTPLALSYLHGEGGFIATDDHLVVHTGISVGAPYTAFAPQSPKPSQLSDSLRSRLLSPMRGVDPRVERLADSVCGGATSVRDKIGAVESFFRDNFTYELKVKETPQGQEPLSHFLLTRPPAHCEYFASGAVALLRAQEIPARYVTGFVVTELEGEHGDYWLARNRHAHAWAEAYDDETQQWVLVEATPGMDAADTTAASQEARFESQGEQEAANEEVAIVGRAAAWGAQSIITVVVTIGLFVLAYYGYSRFRAELARRDQDIDPRLRRIRKMRKRLDRRLRKRRLIRQPSETLSQFANRLHAEANGDPWLENSADWYAHYAAVRYSGDWTAIENLEPLT